MRWLRTTWKLRAVAFLLVTSLVPMALVWPKSPTARTPAETHANWLRTQVRAEMDDAGQAAFEAALERAVEAEARSLQDFLRHFIDAYTQRTAGPSFTQLFGVAGHTHWQVVQELQRRLAQISGWAAVPRLSTALHASSSSPSHRIPFGEAILSLPHVLVTLRAATVRFCSRVLGSALIRALVVAQPRAP